jgi:DNA-directed RNA polymerase specialized sigma24 family protein
LLESGLTLRELEQRYASLIYLETGNYSEAGRRLDVDRRTLKQHVSQRLLKKLRQQRAI